MMLEMQPLRIVRGFLSFIGERTYNRPVAKTADTPIFLCMGIWRRQTATIGNNRIVKSETTLIVPPATKTCSLLMQCPGSKGSQSLLLGMHGQISTGRFAI